jgi:hypothetical protein
VSAQLDVTVYPNSPHKVDAASTDHRLGHASNLSGIDLQIDPVLLALDGNVATGPAASSSKSLQLVIPPSSQGPPSPGQSRLQPSARHHGTFSPAQVPLVDSVSQTPRPSSSPVAKLPSDLSPTSRRRLQKRLWARRKRATESGLPASEVSTDVGKLKRGRKPKTKLVDDQDHAKEDLSGTHVRVDFHDVPATPTSEPHPSEIQGDAVGQSGDKGGTSDESGSAAKRKPYGWGKLTRRQVSGVTLCTDGMDLFHMEKFASMMRYEFPVILQHRASPILYKIFEPCSWALKRASSYRRSDRFQ